MATDTIFAPPRKRPWVIDRLLKGAVRATAFTGKELHEVFRQPRLLIGLIIGPFLILLLFGSSFRGQIVRQPTVLVVPANTGLSADAKDYQQLFQFPFTLAGVVQTPEEAQSLVDQNKATIIVTLPDDAYDKIRAGQHPLVNINYDQLEPVRADQFRFYSYVEVNELNRRVLIAVVNQAKSSDPSTAGPPLQGYPEQIQAQTTDLDAAVRARDAKKAADIISGMQTLTANNQSDVNTRVQLLTGVESYFSVPTKPNDDIHQRTNAVNQSLNNVQTVLANITVRLPQNLVTGSPDMNADGSLLANANAATDAAQALQLPPAEVLIAPFQAEVKNRAPVVTNVIAFYGPAVLALLLQHISITLTALTLVRERTLGATELFRVSPSAVPEIVFGKFIGYALIAGLAGVILTVLLKYTLHVPMRGSYGELALVVALLIAASLGVGFIISSVSRTETQAVQYAMIVLLASVFFGNFFLPIDSLYPWARVVSYALPITYGTNSFQEIALRGVHVTPLYPAALGGFAVVAFLLGTLLFRREMRRA